jgi:hypothetical protein
MTRRLLHLSGSTPIERHDMNARVAEAISHSGAVLVDFSMFANLSTTMRVELPARAVCALGRRLCATGLTLDDASHRSIAAWSDGAADDVVATLKITFLHDKREHRGPLAASG